MALRLYLELLTEVAEVRLLSSLEAVGQLAWQQQVEVIEVPKVRSGMQLQFEMVGEQRVQQVQPRQAEVLEAREV